MRMEAGLARSTPSPADTRSVEELLSFIQEDGVNHGKGKGKKKKGKKKRESLNGKEDLADAVNGIEQLQSEFSF